jgi:DNA repair exonuclease SbcCD nuclease subunit
VKLAHLADLHLGFRRYYRQTPAGINQREADVARAFARAIDDIVTVEPDILVIAGDLFHSVRPTNPAILHAFNQLKRVRTELPQTPVVVVAGNHDTPRSVETGTILKLFEVLGGVHVVSQEARELSFGSLDLSLVCVPHSALLGGGQAIPEASPAPARRVLVTHGEVAGVLSQESSVLEYGGAVVEKADLRSEEWSFVALGHYHVARPVASNAWYAGSLEYVSTNPWGEMVDEEREGRRGKKGWLLVDLDGEPDVEFRPVELERRLIDLEPIQGAGLGAAELNGLIERNVAAVAGGISDEIVRQVVYDVPRPITRDLDHARIREYKAQALHYNLDVRRPPPSRTVGVGAPGRRQTLAELVDEYLGRRELQAEVDRKELVSLGRHYVDEVQRDLLEE